MTLIHVADPTVKPLIAAGIGLVGVTFFFVGLNTYKRCRRIQDTPTSKIRSMPVGHVEVRGTASCNTPLISPRTKTPCVYYDYEVLEKRVSTIRTGMKTHKVVNWVSIERETKSTQFFLKDETGICKVDPTGVSADELSGKITYSGNKKYIETFVPVNSTVYVLGSAAPLTGATQPDASMIIKKGEIDKEFYMSDSSEKAITNWYGISWKLLMILAVLCLIVAADTAIS